MHTNTYSNSAETTVELVPSPTDMQTYSYLAGKNGLRLTSDEMNSLKVCLGGSDDNDENNIEVVK